MKTVYRVKGIVKQTRIYEIDETVNACSESDAIDEFLDNFENNRDLSYSKVVDQQNDVSTVATETHILETVEELQAIVGEYIIGLSVFYSYVFHSAVNKRPIVYFITEKVSMWMIQAMSDGTFLVGFHNAELLHRKYDVSLKALQFVLQHVRTCENLNELLGECVEA